MPIMNAQSSFSHAILSSFGLGQIVVVSLAKNYASTFRRASPERSIDPALLSSALDLRVKVSHTAVTVELKQRSV